MLLGDGPQERLFHASVALFGVGGVGGFCAEALARSTARSTISLVLKLMKIAVTSATAVSCFA